MFVEQCLPLPILSLSELPEKERLEITCNYPSSKQIFPDENPETCRKDIVFDVLNNETKKNISKAKGFYEMEMPNGERKI